MRISEIIFSYKDAAPVQDRMGDIETVVEITCFFGTSILRYDSKCNAYYRIYVKQLINTRLSNDSRLQAFVSNCLAQKLRYNKAETYLSLLTCKKILRVISSADPNISNFVGLLNLPIIMRVRSNGEQN
ncbi:hypothetical protein Gasu2_60630 [Galdieria sulphuraria]|nr:hypothetical protein Gasu2_60630 [Galdieria sulphuraria]